MRALILDDELHFDPHYPHPERCAGQALIRIHKAGICNTDLELAKGYMGFHGVLGHEFVGTVIDGSGQWLNRRVVGEINVADHTCDLCQRGIYTQCRHRTTVGIDRHDGGFADYLALDERNLHFVPDHVTDDQAVFTEPLAAAFQVLEALHISPRDRVIVIGAGKLGLLVAQVVKLTGAALSVVARRERSAALLRQWGIHAVSAADVPPGRAQIVVDCTGTQAGFGLALDWVEPRGAVVLKSTYAGLPTIDLTRVAVNEIRVIGSRCGPFEAALRALADRTVDVTSLIDATYPLDQAEAAMKAAAEPGRLKVLLEA
ncbi:MAG: alcohol dehydrogenase catalytic domain-containing protein [bacterium]|nr:alcohol dehydrogenase catalytic domain-containing protein [bacterium]